MIDISYPVVIAAAKTWFKLGDIDIRMSGMENIPEKGGVLLAVNHLSFVDYLMAGYPGVQRGRLTRCGGNEAGIADLGRDQRREEEPKRKRRCTPGCEGYCIDDAPARGHGNVAAAHQHGGGGGSTSFASIALRPSGQVSCLKSIGCSVAFSFCAQRLRLQKSS